MTSSMPLPAHSFSEYQSLSLSSVGSFLLFLLVLQVKKEALLQGNFHPILPKLFSNAGHSKFLNPGTKKLVSAFCGNLFLQILAISLEILCKASRENWLYLGCCYFFCSLETKPIQVLLVLKNFLGRRQGRLLG